MSPQDRELAILKLASGICRLDETDLEALTDLATDDGLTLAELGTTTKQPK